MTILLVDDEALALQAYESQLLAEGLGDIKSCSSGAEAIAALRAGDVGLMLLDLRMPGMSGEEVLAEATRLQPDLPVIVVTAVNEAETAMQCVKGGAFDYLVKPVDPARLLTSLHKALEFNEIREENAALANTLIGGGLRDPRAFAEILTGDPRMRSLFRYVESIGQSSQPVLINGETGTGKELFAQAIHVASGRKGPLVAVNIAGLDEETFADTLFGHRRGAFTGADRERGGLIERAEGGTLFLDEIGELGERAQVRLLRLLQEREYYPLGSDIPRKSSARVVAATNRDLEAASRLGTFRQDLYYRLHLHHLAIPPLRQRLADIPALARTFLAEAAEELGIEAPDLSPSFRAALQGYEFPGNVRELRSLIFEAVTRISVGEDPVVLIPNRPSQAPWSKIAAEATSRAEMDLPSLYANLDVLPSLDRAEDLLIAEAMSRTSGNRTLAASLLGVTRQTLIRRAKKETAED